MTPEESICIMDPIFIYFDELEFDKETRFTIRFTNNEENKETNYFLLSKNKDYSITSMKCYLEIEGKIEDLSNCDKIKEASNIGNDIIENGIDHLYKFNKMEHIIDTGGYENKRITFSMIKLQRYNHIRNFKFHDLKTNTEKTIKVYSAFDELRGVGLKFKNDTLGEYTITLSKYRKNLQKYF